MYKKKLSVVELYLSSELSYQDLALQEDITNPCLITNWVNRFHISGPGSLRPRKKGHRKTLDNLKKNTAVQPVEETTVDTNAEHIKELEDELLKLKIDNAFLITEKAVFKGRSKNERTARITNSFQRQIKLKDLISYTGMPKATYMYWQKRFDRVNPDKKLDEKILEVRELNKDYRYRRKLSKLHNQGYLINKKKMQQIGTVAPNNIRRRFNTHIPHQ